jgi:hypothetical protein
MSELEYNKLLFQIGILKDVANRYPYKTIENIITQMETIKKEIDKSRKL